MNTKDWRTAIGALAVSVLVAATSMTAADPAVAATRQLGADGCTQTADVVSCTYVGQSVELTVPDDVHGASIVVAGGSGGNSADTNSTGGAGFETRGHLSLTPGVHFFVGVGGRGEDNNVGTAVPGAGGWGIDGFTNDFESLAGGRGGGGKGLDGRGGSGGGGASAIVIGGLPAVIAPGGGGAAADPFIDGGISGTPAGGRGEGSYWGSATGGYGGSPNRPNNARTGATPKTIGSGGGGGGGGYYTGEGGGVDKVSAEGGGGGGGGYWDSSIFAMSTCAKHQGAGAVTITWDAAKTTAPGRPGGSRHCAWSQRVWLIGRNPVHCRPRGTRR